MENVVKYRGYEGSINFSTNDMIFYGRLTNASDLVTYRGKTADEFYADFKKAVNTYIEFLNEKKCAVPGNVSSNSVSVRVQGKATTLSPKLSHLSKKQVETLLNKYKDPRYPIKDLIEEYGLNVSPSKLITILPLIQTGESCQRCGAKLVSERAARSEYSTYPEGGRGNKQRVYCPSCGHIKYFGHFDKPNQRCECPGCEKERTGASSKREKLIKDYYGKVPSVVINFNELNIRERFFLMSAILSNPLNNTHSLRPVSVPNNSGLFPRSGYVQTEMRRALLEACVIRVSPESSPEAFRKDDFPKHHMVSRVMYEINPQISENEFKNIINKSPFDGGMDDRDVQMLVAEVACMDIIEKYKKMLCDVGINPQINGRGVDAVKSVLIRAGYSKTLYICKKTTTTLQSGISSGKITREMASRVALDDIASYYDRAVKLGWKIGCSGVDVAGAELWLLIENFLKKKLDILLNPIEIDESKTEK